MSDKIKVAILCGGPSLERGISLNSARSLCDHLESSVVEVVPIYFDHAKKPYKISRGQLYSNTPSDFDFKLNQTGKPLNKTALRKLLKTVDIAFPAMHGAFGEDGEIQSILEKEKIPYIGSPKEACKICFDKYFANEFIKSNKFFALPSTVLKIHDQKNHQKILQNFFREHHVSRAVVKPATGGSSIGVHSVANVREALRAAKDLFNRRMDTRVVVEPFCEGIEFTVIILENRFGLPVSLMPTEIETDYSRHQLFDYRRKYLATRQVTYHCPPRFSDEIIEKIQIQAEHLFKLLNMRDFARFDGWLLKDGNIWFSDFNPISGMEQNSFLFMQSAQLGFSHRSLLEFILKNACRRYGLKINEKPVVENLKRKKINVLFGGNTAERQVSVMTGTNAWLKLRNSKKYDPSPYLLDTDNETVWKLPYNKTLNHTQDEISEMCRNAHKDEKHLEILRKKVLTRLAVSEEECGEDLFLPQKMTLKEFIKNSKYVFIGLHGGIGENGTLQAMLTKAKVPYNGSHEKASHLCMDKYLTGETLMGLKKQGISTAPKKLVSTKKLFSFSEKELKNFWKNLQTELNGADIIIKPKDDGCSAGIAKINSVKDLSVYLDYLKKKIPSVPKNTFTGQLEIIEMPVETPKDLIFETFIYTDKIKIIKNQLHWQRVSGLIEITMGVLEIQGKYTALNPSLTVSSGTVLTLEEKFQGGTGVNITPPPQPYVKISAIEKARKRMEIVAAKLGISGYARIDAFMDTKTGELIIIEANTTPALTPSTVLFHQGLAENPQMYPRQLLERIIENS